MKSCPTPPRRAGRAVRLLAVTLLPSFLLSGCARGGGPSPMDSAAASYSTVQVTIQNNDFSDAVVYADWEGSTRRRVGMVTGKTTETFTIDWQADIVRFVADFVGRGSFTFDPIQVYRGDHLDLVIMIQG